MRCNISISNEVFTQPVVFQNCDVGKKLKEQNTFVFLNMIKPHHMLHTMIWKDGKTQLAGHQKKRGRMRQSVVLVVLLPPLFWHGHVEGKQPQIF